MNRSGLAVSALARFYRIAPGEILVAHDELDLKPGTVKLKRGGGFAGHNGLRDIAAALGTADFWRRESVSDIRATARCRSRKSPTTCCTRRRATISRDRRRHRARARDLAPACRGRDRARHARIAHASRRRDHRKVTEHERQMRHRRASQRRQVDAFQRAHQGRHRRRELSVLHHRAQCRDRRSAGPASGGAGGDRQAREGIAGRGRIRRHRGTGRGGVERRRASATSSSPTSARPTPSRTSCAASSTRTSFMSRARSIPYPTSRPSTPSSRSPTSRRWRSSSRNTPRSRAPAATRRRSAWSPRSKK